MLWETYRAEERDCCGGANWRTVPTFFLPFGCAAKKHPSSPPLHHVARVLNPVSPKRGGRFMAEDAHRDVFVDARMPQIARGAEAQVVND
jgi:hypothetical protein